VGAQIERFSCVVLGAGEILDYSRVASFIASGAFVICADGGANHCAKLGLSPNLLVGDFDSLPGQMPPGTERIPLCTKKNYTDSFHAAEQAQSRGHTRLLLSGMLGGRLDHTLGNLSLLAGLTKAGASALLTDGRTDVYALAGEGELALPNREGCYFSVLAFESCCDVSIAGGKFPLENYPLSPDDPRALSNEFAGKDVRITQKSGLLIATSCPK